MKRLLVHVEGQTEEEFTNQILSGHFVTVGFESISARLLGSRRDRAGRGGVRPWAGVKREIERHLLNDGEVLAGLLVDYYGMPHDWPGRTSAETLEVPARSRHLARSLHADIDEALRGRFFPCILMHEFEAMAFIDPQATAAAWGSPELAEPLEAIRKAFPTVEHINDSPMTAPSKRLLGLDPQYEKPLQGLLVVLELGLERVRRGCPSINDWLTNLEAAAGAR